MDRPKKSTKKQGRPLVTRGSHLDKVCGEKKWLGDRFVYIWGNQ